MWVGCSAEVLESLYSSQTTESFFLSCYVLRGLFASNYMSGKLSALPLLFKSENSTYNTSYMKMAVNKEILQLIV